MSGKEGQAYGGCRAFYLELLERLKTCGFVTVSTVLTGEHAGEKFFGEQPGEQVFCETFFGKITAVICGGGHVALSLARILKGLEYEVTVIDDREEFANRERFPFVDRLLCMDFETEFPKVEFPSYAYYVILTRGHEHDYSCLSDILTRKYGYLGMIGSKIKVKQQRERLAQDGFTQEQIASVYAPIGLPIGGQTPEEIAVSIAAQMIQVKNQKEQNALDRAVQKGLNSQEAGVMVTIIDKKGSSPRGRGTCMIVSESGKLYGTIGGGAVEYEAAKRAQQLCRNSQFEIRQYDLSNEDAAKLGMICGGRVTVMFEPLV